MNIRMSLELIYTAFVYKSNAHNKFQNIIGFVFLSLTMSAIASKKLGVKYFFAHAISKLAQFTPFASVNIPSKRDLLIISAKILALYYASIY